MSQIKTLTLDEIKAAVRADSGNHAITTYDGSSKDYPIGPRADLSLIPTGYGYSETYFARMAPLVTVNSRKYTRPVMDKTAFTLEETERPYYKDIDVIHPYAEWIDKTIKEYVLGVQLDLQMDKDLTPFSWERGASAMAEFMVMNKFEKDAVDTLKASSTYTNKTQLAGATLWSATTGTPDDDIRDARETIFDAVGTYPNKMFLSRSAWNDLMSNAQITALPSVNKDKLPEILKAVIAARYELDEVVVMGSMYANTPSAAFTDMWGWRCILAVVNPTPPIYPNVMPSFAYTYGLNPQAQALPSIHSFLSESGLLWTVACHKFLNLDILMETAAYLFYT